MGSPARHQWEKGNRLFEKGQVAQAIEAFQQAVRLDPNFAEAYNSLGVSFYERKDYPQALSFLQKAVLLKPDFVEAFNNLGVCYLFLGRLRDAAAAFEKVAEVCPDFAEAHNNLGLVYEQLSMTDRALHHYREFVRLWQGNQRYVLAAKERIDRISQGRTSGVSEPSDVLDLTNETDRVDLDTTTIQLEEERKGHE